ncbi:MAG: hypothetical protein ABFS09_12615 [Thermodesulfobacteriota bacterium]
MRKPISMTVTFFLFMVSLLHVLRLVFHVNVSIGETAIPLWLSIFGAFIPAALAVLLRVEGQKG